MKIILEDYTIECSIEEYEILLIEGYLYKESLDNMKKVFFEPKKEVNFTKVSMKKQTFDEDGIESHTDENIKSIPKKKSDVDTKLDDDYFDNDSEDDEKDEDKKDEDKQMETTKEVIAKNKKHLLELIKDAIKKYGNKCDLNFIDVSRITNMICMFASSKFNGDISKWDVSNVTNMTCMFAGSDFNGDISKWNVSKVENMRQMFRDSKFNGNISKWDVSKVKDMGLMFYKSNFNGDISKWIPMMKKNGININDLKLPIKENTWSDIEV